MRVILVAGTHAFREGKTDWWQPGSPFAIYLKRHGLAVVGTGPEERPYVWSTDLGGMGLGRGDLQGWRAAGLNLYAYAVPPLCPDARIPSRDLAIVCHSHGLQPVLYACAEGLKIGKLVSIGSPVRRDMADVAEAARPNIRSWVHLHGDHQDRWQWFGSLFDGHWGIVRQHPLANVNRGYPVGHGNLVRDPEWFGVVLSAITWPLMPSLVRRHP